jgi:F420-dependent oxidoreductase-like protein
MVANKHRRARLTASTTGATMRIGVTLDHTRPFHEEVDRIVSAEHHGLDVVAVPEAYTFDAVSQLGYLAARTSRVGLLSTILQIYSRTPALLAMTAAGIDVVSNGRFELGIGASGPQVVEGFHGIRYDAPIGRTREIIEICRKIWRRDALTFDGTYYRLPLRQADGGSGLGKPLKLVQPPPRTRIPIAVAALGLRNVAMAAEVADAWQPVFFDPRRAEAVWGPALAAGTERRSPELPPLDVQLQISVLTGTPTHDWTAPIKRELALYIGGMGAPDRNFYHRLAGAYGYSAEAARIQDLFLAGRRAEAASAVPDELVESVSLVGDEAVIRSQIDALAAAGVTTLMLKPHAPDPSQRMEDLLTVLRLASERGAVAPEEVLPHGGSGHPGQRLS